MLKKVKDKAKQVKKFIHTHSPGLAPSRSSNDSRSILTGQLTPSSTHVLDRPPTNTSDQADVTVPTGPPALLSASLQRPPSTPTQVDERALPSASASVTSTLLPQSTQASKSKSMKIAKDAFKTSLFLLNAALPGLPFKGAFTAAIEIIKIAEQTAANGDDLKELNMHCNLIRESIGGAFKGKDESRVPVELSDSILQLQNGLEKVCEHLKEYERNTLSRKLVAVISSESDSKMIQGINKDITRLLELFWLENHITGTIILRDVLSAVEKQDILTHDLLRQGATLREDIIGTVDKHTLNQRIQSLPRADAAAYNSYISGSNKRQGCFQGTRESILRKIAGWIGSADGQPIYVLHGIAGIGKSTIAQTIAQRAAELGHLGASFFFSRNEEHRSNGKLFFSTIALQLSQYNPEFASSIGAALERTPDAPTRGIRDQLKELIIAPLRDLCHLGGHTVLIVIDAMDECDVQDAKEILNALTREAPQLFTFKVFITTRPEQHIRHILSGNHERFYLHEVERSVVEADIRHYLRHQLSPEMVQNELPDLQPPPWEPSLKDLDALVKVAGKLFIIASTAVRFILDTIELNPGSQMARLLDGFDEEEHTHQKPEQVLDNVYLQILRSAVPEDSRNHIVKRFQTVVGTIILLRDPLPAQALANLIVADINDVHRALSNLYSIIPFSSQDGSPQIYHKSFPDFITNAERCSDKRFLITPKVHHSRIANHCFRIMARHLRENICDLGFPERYLDNSEVRHLTDGRMSQELIYACLYWAEHLSRTNTKDNELLEQVDNFAFNHILNWLEVLSFIRRLDVAHPALEHGKRFAHGMTNASTKLRTILDDSGRFVARYFDIIERSALHTYHSALTLTPHDTELFRTYSKKNRNALVLVSGIRNRWDPLIAVLGGHSSYVNDVAFSPDGSKIASASNDGTIRLWDGATGASIACLEGHSSSVQAITFSPDGSKIVSASKDRTVQLWDGTTGASIVSLEGHSDCVYAVAFSPDGTKIASASNDKTVRLWDGATGASIVSPKGHSGYVHAVTFSPDGTKIASASSDKTVRLWDGATGASIASLEGHSHYVYVAIFSPDSSKIASASDDGTIRLWDGATGAFIASLKGHSDYVFAVAFSPDASKIASASGDNTIRLWDGATGASIACLKGHSDSVCAVAFSPDGSKIASGSFDKTVRLWDGVTGTSIANLESHSLQVGNITFSPDGLKIASASGNTIRLWDGATGAIFASLERHSDYVYEIAFSPDGSKIASASGDNTIRLWDGATGASIACLKGHSGLVRAVAFSPDGSKFTSASIDNTVRLWDGATGASIACLRGHLGAVYAVAFSPDGSKIASASSDKTVRLWDGATGASIACLKGHSDTVCAVAFSPDGSKIASASLDRTVRLWDGATGASIACLKGHSDAVRAVAFSPDGSKIASASIGTPVRLWDGATGEPISNEDDTFQFLFSLGHPVSLSIKREDSSTSPLLQITASRLGDPDPAHIVPLCWLTRDMTSRTYDAFAYTSSHAAIGCEDGRVMLFDIRNLRLD